jgi:hypothetical protein
MPAYSITDSRPTPTSWAGVEEPSLSYVIGIAGPSYGVGATKFGFTSKNGPSLEYISKIACATSVLPGSVRLQSSMFLGIGLPGFGRGRLGGRWFNGSTGRDRQVAELEREIESRDQVIGDLTIANRILKKLSAKSC